MGGTLTFIGAKNHMSIFKFMKCSTLTASIVSLTSLATLFGANPSYGASLTNGGFETGTFSGWETIGDASIQDAEFGAGPKQGIYQALITTAPSNLIFDFDSISGTDSVPRRELGGFLGLTAADAGELLNTNAVPIEGSGIKQEFTAKAGDILKFSWKFLTNEFTGDSSNPFNDFAFSALKFLGSPPNTFSDVDELADANTSSFSLSQTIFRKETNYTTVSVTLPSTGTYRLGFGVADGANDEVNSGLLVDNVSLQSVPESSSVLGVLVFGAFGIGSVVKRKQQQKFQGTSTVLS